MKKYAYEKNFLLIFFFTAIIFTEKMIENFIFNCTNINLHFGDFRPKKSRKFFRSYFHIDIIFFGHSAEKVLIQHF